MSTTINSQFIFVQGGQIHYLERGAGRQVVLFLHGASFKAQIWQEIGSLSCLARAGYRSIAVDLPGFGRSTQVSGNINHFLDRLITTLQLEKPIIVSPSMSGRYSLPLVTKIPLASETISGFVAVAPVGIRLFEDDLAKVKIPTLALWGSNDRIVPVEEAQYLCQLMPNATLTILVNAGHACYIQATETFHKHLLAFVRQVFHK